MDKNPLILDSVQKSDVFKGLTDEQCAEVIRSGFRKKLQSESILFHQGDPAISCFLVNRGLLKLTKINEHGQKAMEVAALKK